MKKKIVLSLIFLTTCFIYKKTGPGWITGWGIDPATYLFICLIPLIWFYKISSDLNAVIAIFFLVLMAVFSIAKNDQTAENFAILAYFFLCTSVFLQIKELIKNKNNHAE